MKTSPLKKPPVQLTNDGNLSLFFVGVGSAFSKRNFQTNLLIVKGDEHVLVDCGTRCPEALHNLGLHVTDIKNFLITHSHADHIGGLEEAMLMNRYFARKKANIIITEIYQHLLWDLSLRGGTAYSEEIDGKLLDFGDMWDILRPRWKPGYPRETFEIELGPLNIKMVRTKHIPEQASSWEEAAWSCGLIIDDRILFTSDTRFDRDLLLKYDARFNFENIFHDCQFFTGGVHASLDELSTLPKELKQKMILVHYGDNWEDKVENVQKHGFHSLARQWVFYTF
ncbi:MAG: MBL fold metallo-hydrolase [Spirochaetia bacterium]